MRAYNVGQLVKEKRGDRWGEIVAIEIWPESGPYKEARRYEVHIKNGAKLDHNPVFREFEIEHYQEKGRVHA